NKVDTTLSEEPELAPPDMSVKSGATTASAGTPKMAVGGLQSPTFVKPAVATEEEDPFGSVAVAEAEVAVTGQDLQTLLRSARQLISSLETSLERARDHERELSKKIGRL